MSFRVCICARRNAFNHFGRSPQILCKYALIEFTILDQTCKGATYLYVYEQLVSRALSHHANTHTQIPRKKMDEVLTKRIKRRRSPPPHVDTHLVIIRSYARTAHNFCAPYTMGETVPRSCCAMLLCCSFASTRNMCNVYACASQVFVGSLFSAAQIPSSEIYRTLRVYRR